MTLYSYPKAAHKRRLNPGPFADYRKYKPYLRDEFGKQCVYCRRFDGPMGPDTFGADHYRPQSLFPELAATYANLFYCCNACNRWKGAYWPSDADRLHRRFLPNPCDHRMFDHLRYVGARVDGRTPAGEHAIDLLHLDDEDAEKYRAAMIATVELLTSKETEFKKTIAELLALKLTVGADLSAQITNDVIDLTRRLNDVQRALSIHR